ncbi:MAG: hypothetical protein A2234_03815 [Elusimicrobia bacterium RIFOXYA2_FULL_58_8]|nr:MAG: hypothetical protein A2285_10060 [Elusimicrobia bacterium RIFOXYA12_FULL_57_11]OGS14014.1 MAG: hypothetical protein A2234_03815 [Elusimicrobia bacterium RIFOXYA2_FULL_58_8]
MESIVFFGKGGIGKSTIASNITAILAAGGRKILHVGCDPKMDCTLSLMGRHIQPFTAKCGGPGQSGLRDSIYPAAVKGAWCIEAGGPQPGVGCGGTAIGSMLDAMRDERLLEDDGYDTAVFDVLGDVVCGGFAAPLRRGFAKKVIIVTSEEVLSLYAANRLIMMVDNYSRNGVYLAGLAVNVKNPGAVVIARDFAKAVNTRILGVMLRDPAVTAAERAHKPAALAYAKSDFARRAWQLSQAINAAGAPATPPRAMPDAEFFAFAEGRRQVPAAAARPRAGAAQLKGAAPNTHNGKSVTALFEAAGMKPSGMEGTQIICEWSSGSGAYKIVIAPAAAAHEGMSRFSDWAVCFHPSAGKDYAGAGKELLQAAARLTPLRFDEMLSVFMGLKNFYGGLLNAGGPDDKTLTAPDTPRRPHTGFGQWQRFIFPGGALEAFIPPGSVMVEHGDSECRFSGCEGGVMGMFSESAGLNDFGRERYGPQLPRCDTRIVNTDFLNDDAVSGDDAKMLRSLNGAAAKAGPGGLVEFYVGCTPMMLASDAAAPARSVEKEKGVKVVLDRYNSFYEHSPAKVAVRVDFMAAKLARAAARPRYDVNFINFGCSAPKMSALLAGRKISAVAPGKDFYKDARSARLQVLSGPDTVLGPAFDKAGVKWLLPAAPYGFAGTSAWLAAIAGALGRKKATIGPSQEQAAQALALWRRAGRFAAGFILAPEEISLLSGSTALKMVPVLPVLAEAGFKIRLFVLSASPTGAPDLRKRIKARVSALKAALPALRVSTELFSTPAELTKLLRTAPALRLVYSDIRRDPRIVAAGKNPFSAALFEPGYAGALETWRRLTELCEWDFNERYLS